MTKPDLPGCASKVVALPDEDGFRPQDFKFRMSSELGQLKAAERVGLREHAG